MGKPKEDSQKQDEVLKVSLPKQSEMSILSVKKPFQIKSLLKVLRITPPKEGNVVIKIYKKEDGSNTTMVRIEVDGEIKSLSWKQTSIIKNVTLEYSNGSLIEIQSPDEEK